MNDYQINKKAYLKLCEFDDPDKVKSDKIDSNKIDSNKVESDKVEQKGGGAWSHYSDGNDYTSDLIPMLNFVKYNYKEIKQDDGTFIEEGETIYYRDVASTNKGLKKMFDMYKKDVIEINKKFKSCKCEKTDDKHVDYCWNSTNYAYLGVIIYLLLNEFEVHTQYLKRALIHAYKQYIEINLLKEFKTWSSWEERKRCLIDEIHLINYAINTSKRNVACLDMKEIKEKKGEETIKTFLKSINKTKKDKFMDHIFFKRHTIRPKYSWQGTAVGPCIDPKILRIGTTMSGYYKRTDRKNKKTIAKTGFTVTDDGWKSTNIDVCVGSFVLDDQIFKDLYGEEYDKLMKLR